MCGRKDGVYSAMSTEVTAVAPPDPFGVVQAAAPKVEKPSIVGPAISAAEDNAVEISLASATTVPADKPKAASVEEIQKNFQHFLDSNFDNKLAFDVQQGQNGGEIHFRITDKDTGKVIREFPPEDLEKVEGAVAKGNVLIDGQA